MMDFLWKEYKEEEKENNISILKENMEKIKNQQIPEFYPEFVSSYASMDVELFKEELDRSHFVFWSSFSLISMDWIRILSKLLLGYKSLEIMAGSGMLSKALSDCGCDVYPTDDLSWSDWQMWMEPEKIDCIEAIKKYGKDMDYILLSWSEMNDMAYQSLITMRQVNPMLKMIYIGEFGWACADENFTFSAKILKNPIIDEVNKVYKRWAGIHDYVFLIG